MKHIITLVTATAALTTASFAQDLNPIKDTALRLRVANQEFWNRPIANGSSPAVLDICPNGSLIPIDSLTLPVDRVGDLIQMQTGANTYRVMIIGSVNAPSTHALPDVDGVAAILDITRNGNSWSSTIVDIETYADIDPWAMAVSEDSVYFLDYATGSVYFSSDFELSASAADLPSHSQLELAMAGSPGNPDWMDSVPAMRFDFAPLSTSGVLLKNLDNPRQITKIEKNAGGTWTSQTIADTFAPANEILIRNYTYAGNGQGMEIKVVSASSSGAANLVVRDPSGVALHTQSVVPGAWVTLPAIAGLGAQPGMTHTMEWGTTTLDFRPTLRYGNSSSQKAGYWIGNGLLAPPTAGIPFEHGVRMHADPALDNEVVTVFALYGLRDAQGNDPIATLPNGDSYLINSWYETYGNVRLGDLNGSMGSQFSVPASTEGLVVLLQYVTFFQDGSMAYSDVFGSTVQPL